MKGLYFEDAEGNMHEIISEALVVQISQSGENEIQVVERRLSDGLTEIREVKHLGRLYTSSYKDL